MPGARSQMLPRITVLQLLLVFKEGTNIHAGGKKQGGNCITGQLIRVCALLKVNIPFQDYYFWYLKGMLSWMHQNNGQGLLQAKINQKSYRPGTCLPTMTSPVRNPWSGHPVRLLSIECFFLVHNINIKIDHRPKFKTIKLLEENIGDNLSDLGLGKDFFEMTSKA